MNTRGFEAGSALIEVLVIGALAIAILVPSLQTGFRLQRAQESVDEAAQVAAAMVARYAEPETAATLVAGSVPGATLVLSEDGEFVTATVAVTVGLTPIAGTISRVVTAQAVAPISPYRSER